MFRAVIEERIERYDYKRKARVPLDFAEEIVRRAGDGRRRSPRTRWTRDVAPPEAAEAQEAEELARRRRLRRAKRDAPLPHVWQVDEMDCGAACLAMVCRHFGRAVSLAHIRQLVHTSMDGTSLAAS